MFHHSTNPLLLKLFIALCLFFATSHAGFLTPYGTNFIEASIANKKQYADYTFSFVPETLIPAGGGLRVIFPSQYDSGLGIITPACSVACTVAGLTVEFTFTEEILAGKAATATIMQVKNPASKGGTGNFQLQTIMGINVLDENLIFDVIGIADDVGALTSTIVSIDSKGISNAGETTRYTFSFKVSQLIPSRSYIKLSILDDNIGLTRFPACNAYAINGKIIQGKFYCETKGRNILVRGLNIDIPASQEVGISVAVINPPYSGITSTFTIAVLREGTNVIYDVKSGIPGVKITAGIISDVSLTKADPDAIQSRKKVMDYILDFHLRNPLGENAVISFEFPPSFLIDTSAAKLRYIRYGLEDKSEDDVAQITVDTSNVLRIKNFVPFTSPQKMSLYLRLINPDNVGESTPVNIRTYLDSLQTILVDEDVTNAYTVIDDITSPVTHSITTSTVTANTLLATFEFQVVPTVSIPANGVLKIRIPDGFTIGTLSASSCMVTNSAGTYVSSSNCYSVGNTISIVLPSTVYFPLAANRRFMLSNVITTPVLQGTFLFDVESYLNDGSTLTETWTDFLVVTPAAFPTSAIDTLERYQGRTTIITGSFTTALTIPAGITQQKTTDLKGFLEFVFTSTSTDLGLGVTTKTQIPCYANAGLSPISGTIKCYLTPGTTPKIQVENFEEVTAGTAVSISFPKILNPPNTYTITMKSVQIVNRIRTEFNSVTVTMTNPASSVALIDSATTSSAAYTFTAVEVCQPTTITFNPTISTTISGPGTFLITLPMYDIGWIPSDDTIICKIGATVFPCVRYQGADWITIRLGSGTTYTAGSSITIQNLQVPRYSDPSLSGIILRYISDTNKQQSVYKVLPAFPSVTVPTFTQATLISDKKNKGAVDVEYTLVFVAPNEIPEGASIVIVFPSAYNLLSSSPAVTFSSPDLLPSTSSSKISFIASIQKLVISGFQTHAALESFSIVVSGLKNPTGLELSETWQAQILYNNNYMVYHDDFDKFVFTPQLTPGTITFNSISSFPLNADEEAVYRINFVPASGIPVGGIVEITFPTENYNDLPSPSEVTITGGITTFSSCSLSGTIYTIVLDTRYESGGIIVIINNVRNPDRGTTEGFIVRTYYDGVILDDTDTTSLTGRTVTLTDGGDRIIVNSLSLDPKNEGEQSTYTFSFVTTNTIESNMQIKLIFPASYDKTLGENIKCASTSGLIGDISCSVEDRIVTVSGFDTYLPDTERPVIIKVFGVVNPNYNGGDSTDQFKIGTLVTDESSFVDYNSGSGSVVILSAPGWAVLYDVVAENLFTRLESDYTFNFTGFANIPRTSSDGAILVDFPSEFDIPDGDINCDTLTAEFSPIITCSFSRNRISINGQTEDYTGNVGFIVRNIQNPIERGTSKNIVLKTYDGLNVRIIERSFKNLDPFMFTYEYPGPLITVNNDEPITTIRGTQTQDIYITVDFPCALNLTLKPYTPGFSIIPFGIDLSLGATKASFRVSVPQSFAEGTYEIEWETRGDIVPAYYTPLKKTQVIVTKQTELKITAPTLNYIPFGGNSLPSSFTVENGPDIQIQITINFLITYPGITLSTNTLTFEAGQEKASFIIYSSSKNEDTGGAKVEKGTLVLSLIGINKDIYTLSTTSLEFFISDTDLAGADITTLEINDITQHSASVNIVTSEVCMIYYMLALAGTVKPELDEVRSKGPAPYASTKSRYGEYQVGSSLTAKFDLENLVAETPYVLYLYFVDGGDNVVSESRKFNTLDRYNGVDFSLKFREYELNQAEKQVIINSISFTLSLFPEKLLERKYIPIYNTRRMLIEEEPELPQRRALGFLTPPSESLAVIEPIIYTNRTGRVLQEEIFVLMNLQLAASPEYSTYPSPKDLATSLNNKKNQVTARLPDSDPDYKIEAFEFVRYQPSFPSVPTFRSVDSTWVAFNGKLDNYGYIFVVCVKVDDDHGTPTPYQILHGYDSRNIEVPSAYTEISKIYTNFVINATGLEPLTNYTGYIVGGSAHPGYPDPMDASDIVAIKFRTEPAAIKARLNIKGGSIVSVAYQTLVVIVVSAWLLL